jgi:hypothetical protein
MGQGAAVSAREALLKDIGDGQQCGGHYNCGSNFKLFPDDRANAAATLGAYLRELAQELRDRQDLSPNEVDGAFAAADFLDRKAAEQ